MCKLENVMYVGMFPVNSLPIETVANYEDIQNNKALLCNLN